ncbi:hypothetical protein GR927_30285 [Mycolicibacterium sp. 3033]|nr:hypothetical protein [Mycolicibacterium aurantiacum]
MTWTKLSDDFSDDCWQLSDAAFRLHVEGLIWSNRKLLDLVLSKDEVQRWAKNPDVAEELVNRGWWEDRGDHYFIVHHGGYQRAAQAVVHQQKVNRENRAKAGKPVKPTREQVASIKPLDESSDGSSDESFDEMVGSGLDGPGQKKSGEVSQLPLAAGAEWPRWQGSGPNPFLEHN